MGDAVSSSVFFTDNWDYLQKNQSPLTLIADLIFLGLCNLIIHRLLFYSYRFITFFIKNYNLNEVPNFLL